MKVDIDGNVFLKATKLPENITSISTTRACNVFDITDSSDKQKKIYLNRGFFKEHFNIDYIVLPKQIHSNKVLYIDDFTSSSSELECDGFVTDKKNVALGILTADCYAVQFFGRNLIANIHCGWRGIYEGIIENTIKIFKKLNDEIILASIGIGICENCYIVGVEMIEKFSNKFGNIPYFKDNYGQHHLSLRKLIKNILDKNGIDNINELNYCSSCNDFLYSYRRDNNISKRLLSLIVME